MDRDRALPLVVALLAVVALGVAAATLDSTVVPGGGSGFGGGDDAGVGDDSASNGTGSPAPTNRNATGPASGSVSACLPFLQEPPALLALLFLFGGLFAATYRSTKSGLAGFAVCGAVGLPVGLLWSALAFCGSQSPAPESTPTPDGGEINATGGAEGGSGGFGGGAEALSSPSLLVALFVVVALVVVAVAALSTGSGRGGGAEAPPDDDDLPGEDPAEAVGRLAGTAADRIDAADADAENEVYRAWTRMTAALDVDSPGTTTPREFQRAAVEAGMDRSDVTALTELFESVRYGGLEPTDERERRAVETLRRIEADYGGD